MIELLLDKCNNMASNEDFSRNINQTNSKDNNGINKMKSEQRLERQSKVVKSDVVEDISTSDSSQCDTEDSQQLARAAMHWSIEELNLGISENLNEIIDYSHKHFYLKDLEGRSHDTIIRQVIRKVRILTSRLVFGAEKMLNQNLNLKRDNARLCERLMTNGKTNITGGMDIPFGEVNTDYSAIRRDDSNTNINFSNDKESLSLFSIQDIDKKIIDHIDGKMDACLLNMQEKMQFLIKQEVQCAFKQVAVVEHTKAMEQLAPKSVLQSSYPKIEIKRRASDSALSYSKIVGNNIGIEDLHHFPSLSKKRIRGNKEGINISSHLGCKNGSTSLPLKFQSDNINNVNKINSSVGPKRNKEDEVILLNILDNNIKFNEVLSELKNNIDLKVIGIEALRLRKTMKGGGIFIITGRDATSKADKLAENMLKVLDGKNIEVIRPKRNIRKKAEIIISGRNDFVTSEEIVTAVVIRGECKTEEVQIGKISNNNLSGRWSVYVKCPLSVGDILCKDKKIRIGWGWASVNVADPPLIRCYKCLKTGHTRIMCKEVEDRSSCCFKCGSISHKIKDCDSSVYKCPLCMNINRECDHRLGDKNCVCPSYEDRNVNCNSILMENGSDYIATKSNSSSFEQVTGN